MSTTKKPSAFGMTSRPSAKSTSAPDARSAAADPASTRKRRRLTAK
jgi:hypothetical protein